MATFALNAQSARRCHALDRPIVPILLSPNKASLVDIEENGLKQAVINLTGFLLRETDAAGSANAKIFPCQPYFAMAGQ